MLDHPLREALRLAVAEKPLSGEELDELYEKLGEHYPFIDRKDLPGSIDALASGAVGGAEGAALALREFLEERKSTDKSTARAGAHNSSSLVQKLLPEPAVVAAKTVGKETGKFLALAGIAQPPDPKACQELVDNVVTLAKGNRLRVELGSKHAIAFPKLDDFAAMGQALLGINSGDDKVVEVHAVIYGGKERSAQLHAFDRLGYNVLSAEFTMKEPGVLYVSELQASHGRNCEDLFMALGGRDVPGRGNAALVAAGLEAVIVEGAKAGVRAIATRPGSPQVGRLYTKMGFTEPGSTRPWRRQLLAWMIERVPVVSGFLNAATLIKENIAAAAGEDGESMVLDLTHRPAVEQALVGFRLLRGSVKDVPKDVSKRLLAQGHKSTKPALAAYRKILPADAGNVRRLKLKA